MSGAFAVQTEQVEHGQAGICVLRVIGSIDASTVGELEAAFRRSHNGGFRCFVLNATEVEYISSAGLRLFLMLRRAVMEDGGCLGISGLRRDIRESVFDALGFSRLIPLYAGAEEAARCVCEDCSRQKSPRSFARLRLSLHGAKAKKNLAERRGFARIRS